MKHRDIQPAHEESVIDSFSEFLMQQGIRLEVIDRPDPPDARVKLNNELCWLEITDAFQNKELARSITTYAAEDKTHVPYNGDLMIEPDQAACETVQEVILKKYNKNTMKSLFRLRGQGILLVGIYTSLTSPKEIIERAESDLLKKIADKAPIFKSIYLYENTSNGHRFIKLL